MYVPKCARHLGQCGSLSGYILDIRTGLKYTLWRNFVCMSLSPVDMTSLGPCSRLSSQSSLSSAGMSAFHCSQSLSIFRVSIGSRVPYRAESGFFRSDRTELKYTPISMLQHPGQNTDIAPLLVKMLQNPPPGGSISWHFWSLREQCNGNRYFFFLSSIESLSLENCSINKCDIGLRLSTLGPLKPGPQMLTALICD